MTQPVVVGAHPVGENGAVTDIPPGWELRDGRLHRELRFPDFAAAWAFMGRVAEVAEAMDHHPDWSNSYGTVVIDLVSHDVGTVTDRDRRLAARIDELAGPFA